jgi:hypothetical protein
MRNFIGQSIVIDGEEIPCSKTIEEVNDRVKD